MVDVLKQQLAQMEVSLVDYETRVSELQKLAEVINSQIQAVGPEDPNELVILRQKRQAISSQIGNCQNQISLLKRRISNLKQRSGMIGVAF